ncbi:hypothetical protein A7K94_0204890 [Modestobacter sp. VKM Ac-2676]|nr:hypothetical protein A7K94_0204890 [Modestobacter sp. VKM Ac-2676]
MRQVRLAAALTIGAAVLTGCSSEQQANQTLPSMSSATASADALPPLGPPDFPMPDEAREMTPEGAEALVRYYVELMDRAQLDSTSVYVRELSTDCDTCIAFAEGVDYYAERSYQFVGGAIRLDAITAAGFSTSKADFAISLHQEALDVLGPDGSPLPNERADAADYPGSGITTVWDRKRSSWLVRELTIA